MPLKVFLLKLASSNWRSVEVALTEAGFTVVTIDVPSISRVDERSVLIVPGVGNIGFLSREFHQYFDFQDLRASLFNRKIKLLGICLGFQFLCSRSSEDTNAKCLGLLNLEVESLFEPPRPSVGWKYLSEYNSPASRANSIFKLLRGNPFYFTHSYGVSSWRNRDQDMSILTYRTDSREEVLAAVITESIIGFQFHPEKSGTLGLQVLEAGINFLRNQGGKHG